MSDVSDIAFAVVLALASALAILVSARAKRAARDYLRFAAALYAALALADLIAAAGAQIWAVQLAGTIVLIVAAIAPAALALAIATVFEGAPKAYIATPLLLLACLAGIFAAITGEAFIALAPLAASACAILALSARRWRFHPYAPAQACVSAVAFLAAAAAFSTGDQGRTAFALFSAAALLGTSLATAQRSHRAVEEQMQRFDVRVRREG